MSDTNNKSIYLRALELTDLDRILSWHNDESLFNHLGGNFRWVSRYAEEEWLGRRVKYTPAELNLAICTHDTHDHIGNIYLRNIDLISRHGELHVFIGSQEKRGQGYGESAVRKLLEYSINSLGLRRIYLHVLAFNVPAIRLYKKCGFTEEGRLRNHAFKNGKFQDVLIMAVLNDEYNLLGL